MSGERQLDLAKLDQSLDDFLSAHRLIRVTMEETTSPVRSIGILGLGTSEKYAVRMVWHEGLR